MSEPETLGAALRGFTLPPAAPRSEVVSSSERMPTKPPSQNSCSMEEFARAIWALTTLKRTSDFTTQQTKAWFCVLKRFPARVLNEAVVELATAETRFPELSDLFRLCQRRMPRDYCPNGGDQDAGKPPRDVIRQIAKDLGLDV